MGSESATTKFDEYGLDSAAKMRAGSEARIATNRSKLFRRCFRPILPSLKHAKSILDFGCGGGELLGFLSEVTEADLFGFDPSATQRELAESRCRNLPRVQCLSDLSGVDQKFDFVFSLHVIEHVPDDQLTDYVGAMLERLAQDGKLVIATPNGLNPLAFTYFMSTDTTHLRMHSPQTIQALLRPFGYEIEQVHRECPQAYDALSFLKTSVWWALSLVLKLAIASTASGVRGFRFPLLMAPSFYCVVGRTEPASDDV